MWELHRCYGDSGYAFITAGDPDNSYLLHKMKGTSGEVGGVATLMPLSGALPDADIWTREDWIAAGAIVVRTTLLKIQEML